MSPWMRSSIFPVFVLLLLLACELALQRGMPIPLAPLAATVVSLCVALVLERWIPRHDLPPEPRELRTDLGFVGLTALVSDPLARAVVAAGTAWMSSHLNVSGMADLPLVAGVAAVLLVHGFGDYWAHRSSHRWPWWWKLHAVHHAPHRMVALNNLRLHPLDLFLKVLFGTGPVLLLGFTPEAIAWAGVVQGILVAFQHADVDLRYGPLNYVLATNHVHRWHHSADPEEGCRNFGGVLSLYDLAFGTYLVRPEHRSPTRLGLFHEGVYPVQDLLRASVAPWCWRRCVEPPEPPGAAS